MAVFCVQRCRRSRLVVPPAPRLRRRRSVETGRRRRRLHSASDGSVASVRVYSQGCRIRRRHCGLRIRRQLIFKGGDPSARRSQLPRGRLDTVLAAGVAAAPPAVTGRRTECPNPIFRRSVFLSAFLSVSVPRARAALDGADLQAVGDAHAEKRAPVQPRGRVGRGLEEARP